MVVVANGGGCLRIFFFHTYCTVLFWYYCIFYHFIRLSDAPVDCPTCDKVKFLSEILICNL